MRYLLLAVTILAVVALSIPGESQIANTDCRAAQTWHLRQALDWSKAQEQVYHLQAATAAEKLSTLGGDPCNGWRTDAQPPTMNDSGVVNRGPV